MGDYPHLQFRRHWTLSSTSCLLLGECAGYVNALARMPLRKAHLETLLQVSLIRGAQATTAIEGNTLTDDEIRRIAEGQEPVVPPSREYQEIEVRNILDAMNALLQEVAGSGHAQQITPDLLRRLHKRVGQGLGEHFDAIPGQFRTDPRVVGTYRCPDAEDVRALVDCLCDWLREEFEYSRGTQSIVDAVVQAIVTHLYIEWIHPFGDGNGRTGRLVELYILLRAGFPDIASHILSNFYNQTRPVYYRKIEEANQNRDLTCFIEYAVEGLRDGLVESLQTVQESQFETAWQRYVYDQFRELPYRKKGVFKRRRELMLAIPLHRDLTREQLATLTPSLTRRYAVVEERALRRDLKLLEGLGLVEQVGPNTYRADARQLQHHLPQRREPANSPSKTPVHES